MNSVKTHLAVVPLFVFGSQDFSHHACLGQGNLIIIHEINEYAVLFVYVWIIECTGLD